MSAVRTVAHLRKNCQFARSTVSLSEQILCRGYDGTVRGNEKWNRDDLLDPTRGQLVDGLLDVALASHPERNLDRYLLIDHGSELQHFVIPIRFTAVGKQNHTKRWIAIVADAFLRSRREGQQSHERERGRCLYLYTHIK